VRKEFLKALAKWLVVLAGVTGMSGCDRELPYMVQADQPINGYRVEGYVTDRLGLPVKGLKIALWYDLDYIDSNNPPIRQFLVDDAAKLARVVVLDQQNRVRRVMFEGRRAAGVLDIDFDLRDSAGALLPTGIYTIKFTMDGVVKGAYTQIINGAVTAATDSLGHYIIPNELLPVEYYPVPIYAGDGQRFIGNYQVSSYIVLEFYLPYHRSATVPLTQDKITRFDYRI
jgi:hypothetical protein